MDNAMFVFVLACRAAGIRQNLTALGPKQGSGEAEGKGEEVAPSSGIITAFLGSTDGGSAHQPEAIMRAAVWAKPQQANTGLPSGAQVPSGRKHLRTGCR